MQHAHAQFTQLFWDNLGKQELGMTESSSGIDTFIPVTSTRT